jgi:hypothetical protein
MNNKIKIKKKKTLHKKGWRSGSSGKLPSKCEAEFKLQYQKRNQKQFKSACYDFFLDKLEVHVLGTLPPFFSFPVPVKMRWLVTQQRYLARGLRLT